MLLLVLETAQHIVEKHHGYIIYTNIPGDGVEFDVTIPLSSKEEILMAREFELAMAHKI